MKSKLCRERLPITFCKDIFLAIAEFLKHDLDEAISKIIYKKLKKNHIFLSKLPTIKIKKKC